jgi:hypothetical protein
VRPDGPSGLTVAVTLIATATIAFAAVALRWSMAAILTTTVAAAVGIALVAPTTATWWIARRSAQARADRRVLARAFEVRCRVDPSRGRRVLARWYPEARRTRPAG